MTEPDYCSRKIFCYICHIDCICEATTHLNLYLMGSEGIRVCFTCRKTLTEIVRAIKKGIERVKS